MKKLNGMIKPGDVRTLRRALAGNRFGRAAKNLDTDEPLIAKCLQQRWATIQLLLACSDCDDDLKDRILREVVKLGVEIARLQKRADQKRSAYATLSAAPMGGDHNE